MWKWDVGNEQIAGKEMIVSTAKISKHKRMIKVSINSREGKESNSGSLKTHHEVWEGLQTYGLCWKPVWVRVEGSEWRMSYSKALLTVPQGSLGDFHCKGREREQGNQRPLKTRPPLKSVNNLWQLTSSNYLGLLETFVNLGSGHLQF